jgi:hypothetical protein
MSQSFVSSNPDYISTPKSTGVDLSGSTSGSVAAWINPSAVGGGTEHKIAGLWSAADNAFSWLLSVHATGVPLGAFQSGASFAVAQGVTSISASAWTLLVLINNAGSITLYVNNVSDATASLSGAPDSISVPFKIGAGGNASSHEQPFGGRISRVAVWNAHALNSTERTNLLTQDPDVAAPTGLTFWTIGAINEIVDYSGGITLTNHGSTYSTSEPFTTGGGGTDQPVEKRHGGVPFMSQLQLRGGVRGGVW